MTPAPSSAFPNSGYESTDGKWAGPYNDGLSYGYNLPNLNDSVTVAVTIDLEGSYRISKVPHNNCGRDDGPNYHPDWIGVEVSTDGQTWASVGSTEDTLTDTSEISFDPIEASMLRVTFKKTRSEHRKDWLFSGEIEHIE